MEERPLNMLLKRLAARMYDSAHAISLDEAEAIFKDVDLVPEPLTHEEVEAIVQDVLKKQDNTR